MAKVDFGGVEKEVCLEFVPDLEVGEYTIVHVGFALQRLDEKSAMETLALFREMGELDMEFGDAWAQAAATTAGRRRHEVPRRVQRPGAGQAAARRHPRHRHPTVGDHGGLRRADALDHPARHRPADPGPGRDDPRSGLPGVRHAARADRQGAGDRVASGRDLLLVRRHAARARQRPGPVPHQERGRRRPRRLLAAGRAQDRAREPRSRGRLLRHRLRDDRPAERDDRLPGQAARHPELQHAGVARARAARRSRRSCSRRPVGCRHSSRPATSAA